jgi:hypothetical protein
VVTRPGAVTGDHYKSYRNAPYQFFAVPPFHKEGKLTMYSIDDVEDNSSLRRGFPVAHSIYGVAQTINSANYVYFCALRELERLNNAQLFKIFSGIQQ